MANSAEKIRLAGNHNVMVCERGTMFGYSKLLTILFYCIKDWNALLLDLIYLWLVSGGCVVYIFLIVTEITQLVPSNM